MRPDLNTHAQDKSKGFAKFTPSVLVITLQNPSVQLKSSLPLFQN
jgi:hypothetical protein